MESDTLDFIIRGRPTILEIVEQRGYNVEVYKNVSPETIMKFATASPELLDIQVSKEDGQRMNVLYWVGPSYRLQLDKHLDALWDTDETGMDPVRDEIVILLAEPFHDAFHLQALKQWNMKKARVSFFQLKNLISNPARHIFVPPHRKLSPEETVSVITSLHMKSKAEFPHIKYHVDMQARVLGLVPGDVVEIRRPSETAGEYTTYRVCVL